MPNIGDSSKLRAAFYSKNTGNPFVPTTPPTISVIDPTGATVVHDQPMTQLGTSALWEYAYTWGANGLHAYICATTDAEAANSGITAMGEIIVGNDAPATVADIVTLPSPLDASETQAATAAALAAYDPPTKAELDSAIASIPTPMSATDMRAALGLSAADMDAQFDALLAHFEAYVATDTATGVVTVRNRHTNAVILTFKLTNAANGVPSGLASTSAAINRIEV